MQLQISTSKLIQTHGSATLRGVSEVSAPADPVAAWRALNATHAAVHSALRDSETFSTRVFQQGLMRDALISQEGDAHARMRKLYNGFFAPRQIKAYEEKIVAPAVREVVDSLARQEQPQQGQGRQGQERRQGQGRRLGRSTCGRRRRRRGDDIITATASSLTRR